MRRLDGLDTVAEVVAPQRRRRSWARVRLAVASLVSVALLALAVVTTYSLMSGSWTLTPVLSGSMAPGLPVGGVAVAQRTSIHNLSVRDVVIFQNPTRPTVQMVHRIIKLTYDSQGRAVIRTQGDANRDPDPWTATISGSSVYVVRSSLPILGYLAIRTNHGLDMMIGGVVVLAVAASGLLSLRARRPRGAED